MNPLVLLDRDGVINTDIGYLWRKEDLTWVPGAPDAIRLFNQRGWPVVVVTNQSGVARGYYREEDVQQLHVWMQQELSTTFGARIDAFYYCPHHIKGTLPDYTRECACRKPQPGMLLRALTDFQGDPARSFLIGDKPSDIEAAEAAGVKGYLFTEANLLEFVQQRVDGMAEGPST